jgi:saccharopine dehydrogenase-like NADP-dependent oxidoreductase
MRSVLLLGAGKIGQAIARYLSTAGDYDVVAADVSADALRALEGVARVRTVTIRSSEEREILPLLKDRSAVLSALPYRFNAPVVRACLESGASYFDLTEDVQNSKFVKEVAPRAREGQIFMPQCGLAPGFVGIAGYDLVRKFEKVSRVSLRVGALPRFPVGRFKYALTWSTDGLVHEYCAPCEAVRDGKLTQLMPLEGLETLCIEGQEYECFNTSGGVGDLCDTMLKRHPEVRTVEYKTIRYPGHCRLLRFLLQEFRLGEDEERAKALFEHAIPTTTQDVVIVYCTVRGTRNGKDTMLSDVRKVYAGEFMGSFSTAIQITTATGLLACVDLHFAGKLPPRGFVRQEDVKLLDFLDNRFGRAYAADI